MMNRAFPLLASLLVLTALPAAAEIYSWKDKDGRTQFSDIPPPRGEIRTLPEVRGAVPRPPAAATPAGEARVEGQRAEADVRTADVDPARKAAADAERQRFCDQARIQLAGLNSGQRVARLNAAGTREFLDDKARKAEAERLQQQLDQHCR